MVFAKNSNNNLSEMKPPEFRSHKPYGPQPAQGQPKMTSRAEVRAEKKDENETVAAMQAKVTSTSTSNA